MAHVPKHRVLFAGNCAATPPIDRIRAAKDAGFTAISLFTTDLAAAARAGHGLEKLRAAIAEAGLDLLYLEMIGKWLPGQEPDTKALPDGLARMLMGNTPELLCDQARILGAQSVMVGELFGLPFDGAAIAPHFARVCDIAADHGLGVQLEFVPTGAVAGLAEAWELIERADRANAGIVVDFWHFVRSGSCLDQLARIPGDRIASIQINDAAAEPEADLFAGMMDRRLPGDGGFDLEGLMAAIAATGTTAPIGPEIFSPALAALPLPRLAATLADALDHCLALLKDPAS